MHTDSELLRNHVETGAEDAFAELVRRYVGLVYSVSLRLTNGDVHLAEDITQEVFIRLIQKAPALIRHEALAGWLHTTTRYVALRTIRARRRREFREQEAAAMNINTAPKRDWDELMPLLDEAVGQLNDRDRQAVLLRYFQGWSHREVGSALGLDEDAARVRTDRAVGKLRHYFARRGVVTSSILLEEALTANSASAAPMGLASKVQAVSLARVKELGMGYAVLKAFFMTTKLKLVLNATIVVLAIGFFATWLIGQTSTIASKPAPSAAVQAPHAAQVEKPTAPPAAAKSSTDQSTTDALTAAQKADVAELKTVLANLANATRSLQSTMDFTSPKLLANRGFTPEILAKMRADAPGADEIEPPTDVSDEVKKRFKDRANCYDAFARAYEALENQIPQFNAAGDEATFEKIEATDQDMQSGTFSGEGRHSLEFFIKIGGKWYLNEDPGWPPNPDGSENPDNIQPNPEINSTPDPFAPADSIAH